MSKKADEELFVPYMIERDRTVRALTSKPVGMELAFGMANGVLKDQGAVALYAPDATWREYPPTERQIEFCERWGLPVPDTKGAAADLITLAISEWAYRKSRKQKRRNWS